MNPDGALLLRLADLLDCDPQWQDVEESIAVEVAIVSKLQAERDGLAAECARLSEDNHELHALTQRQSDLLTATVNHLRGPPPELTTWSHHDVPDLAGLAIGLMQTDPIIWAEWVATLEREAIDGSGWQDHDGTDADEEP